MIFKLLTIFPDMLKAMLSESILGRAIASGAIQAEVIDIRPFSLNKRKNTDDTPYGGGAGMVMLAQPAVDAIRCAMGKNFRGKRIYLSPKGVCFDQAMAERLAKEDELILLAGHYEGLDQRAIDTCIDEEISVGDYVLTGGELGALIITDAVARLLPGVLGSDESSVDESFSSGLLEYPQYTRPREFEGRSVPEVLLNGHQKNIDRWRRDEALKITLERRPELLKNVSLNGRDHEIIRQLKRDRSLKISVLSRDEAKAQEIRSRLYELSDGRITFEGIENVLVLDADIPVPERSRRIFLPRLPRQEETERAVARGAELFGFTPFAFDASFQEIIGDDSIEEITFSGMSTEEFVSLSALWLPIRKIDSKAIHFAKSRRARLTGGKLPRFEARTRTGEILKITLTAQSNCCLRSALDFFRDGILPLEKENIDAAQSALRHYLQCLNDGV